MEYIDTTWQLSSRIRRGRMKRSIGGRGEGKIENFKAIELFKTGKKLRNVPEKRKRSVVDRSANDLRGCGR